MNHSFADHKAGASFKGAMSYLMHDKREAGDLQYRTTSERVDWTATRNLATERPNVATAVMIATAKDADRLKAEAGIRATGRKGKDPVKTFSLSWHPNEAAQLNRAEMERAANGALKAVGMEKHQAIIVCHRDTKHPHVHIVVNRVDPSTGKMAPVGPTQNRALDRWAYEYERDRGQIVSPNRAKKHERRDALRDRYTPEERRAYIDRKKETETKRKRQAQSVPESRAAKISKPSQAEVLRELSDTQKARHKQEWADLQKIQAERRDKLRAEWRTKFRDARKAYSSDPTNKAKWKRLGRDQWRLKQQREALERTFTGRLALSITAAKEQRILLAQQGKKVPGLAALTWSNLLSPKLRQATWNRAIEADKKSFEQWANRDFDHIKKRLNESREQAYGDLRDRYKEERATLVQRQNSEQAKVREAWRFISRDTWGQGMASKPQEQRDVANPVRKDERDSDRPKTALEQMQENHGKSSLRQDRGDGKSALEQLREGRAQRDHGGGALDQMRRNREGREERTPAQERDQDPDRNR